MRAHITVHRQPPTIVAVHQWHRGGFVHNVTATHGGAATVQIAQV